MVTGFSLDQLAKGPDETYLHISKNSKIPLILFGSGAWGIGYLDLIKDCCPVPIIFCDNSPEKWDTLVHGIPVISFDELKRKYNKSPIVITSVTYYDEILKQLTDNGLRENASGTAFDVLFCPFFKNYFELVKDNLEKFSLVYSMLSDELSKQTFYAKINYSIAADARELLSKRSSREQYFETDFLPFSEEEIFIDGGAFTGDTAEAFIQKTNGKFKRIYSFEPEKTKHEEFREKFKAFKNIDLFPYGLWNKKEMLRFNSNGDGSSCINDAGTTEIPGISIDEVLAGQPATYIKMDIEGAELEALKGAKDTITKYKPKLAICVYHKPLHIIEIPLYIKELVPEYKLYLRHYSPAFTETVLYAVAREKR